MLSLRKIGDLSIGYIWIAKLKTEMKAKREVKAKSLKYFLSLVEYLIWLLHSSDWHAEQTKIMIE